MEVVIKLQLDLQLTQLCRSTQMKAALLATGLRGRKISIRRQENYWYIPPKYKNLSQQLLYQLPVSYIVSL